VDQRSEDGSVTFRVVKRSGNVWSKQHSERGSGKRDFGGKGFWWSTDDEHERVVVST